MGYYLKNWVKMMIAKRLNKGGTPERVHKRGSFEGGDPLFGGSFEKEFANFCVDVTASK
jgi:hypothetical protein